MNFIYFPKKVKFKKLHKHRSKPNYKPFFENKKYTKKLYGMFVTSFGFMRENHIELIRRFLTRTFKKVFKFKLMRKIHLTQPFTKKATKARMGKGVGKFNFWGTYLYPGKMLFEFNVGKPEYINKLNMKLLNKKLPFSCNIFMKQKITLSRKDKKYFYVNEFNK